MKMYKIKPTVIGNFPGMLNATDKSSYNTYRFIPLIYSSKTGTLESVT